LCWDTADVISIGMLAVGQLTESDLGFLFSFSDNDGRIYIFHIDVLSSLVISFRSFLLTSILCSVYSYVVLFANWNSPATLTEVIQYFFSQL
jgi:hypothetical protein